MRWTATLFLVLTCSGVLAAEMTVTAADGYPLKVDYYAAESGQPGVVLLHQCNGDRSMYRRLGRAFAEQGVHAVALDFRGFGDSVSGEFDFAALTEGLTTREEMIRAMVPISRHWPSDVDAVLRFLSERTGEGQPIGVGGASCGGGQAALLAMRADLSALMMLSSAVLDEDREGQIDAISSLPSLFIAADEDERPYRGNRELFAAARHGQSRMVVYKGDAHGSPLFDQDPTLVDSIVAWFRVQLQPGTSAAR